MRRAALVVALLLIALMAAVVPAAAQVPQLDAPPEAGGVQKQVGQSEVGNSVEQNAPAEVKTAQQQVVPSDDDSAGHETANPGQPEHARGEVALARLQGDHLVTVGQTNSQVEDSNRARGDAVVLALLGNEVAGAHSDSRGTRSEQQGLLQGLCAPEDAEATICLDLLYARTASAEDRRTSASTSDVALAFVCIGGGNAADPSECRRNNGAIGVGLATAHSDIVEDRSDGRTVARQETDLADVCLAAQGGPLAPTCTVGVQAAHSESVSDTHGTTRRDSFLLNLQLGGQNALTVREPTGTCLEPLLCLFLNQGETRVFTGGHSGRQEALHLELLPADVDLVFAHLGTAETLVERDNILGRQVCPPVCPPGPGDRVLGERGPTAAGAGAGALPFTGWNLLLPLGLAIGFVIAGAGLVRRR